VREVLEQLARVPGVVGALAAGPRGELLASVFPPLFDELALHQVAALFSDDTAGLRRLAGPDGALDVRYARGRALAKPFAHGTILVIATAAVDAALVGLSMEQVARRFDGAPPPVPSAAATRTSVAGHQIIPPAVLALRAPLQELLVGHIGPVGELIFSEAWAAWSGAAPPSLGGLARLVEDLAREVDDPADRARFVAAARTAIGG
jgi:hypothetical protein